jgi:roadblock/LC7 domain-containing protein
MKTANEIITQSYIGTIDTNAQMMTGKKFGEYRTQVEQALAKVLAMVPQAVEKLGDAQTAGYQAQSAFARLVKMIGASDYYTTNSQGQKAITCVTLQNMEDIKNEIMNACLVSQKL